MPPLIPLENKVPTVQAPVSRLTGQQISAPYQELAHALDKQGMSIDAAVQATKEQAAAANTKAQAAERTAQSQMTIAASDETKARAEESLGQSAKEIGIAEGRGLNAWATAYEHIGGVLMRDVAVPAAERAGETAVTRDADGNVQIQQLPLFGDAATAYQRAMKTSAVTEAENMVRQSDIQLRQKYVGDPQGYLEAAAKQRDDLAKQFGDQGGQEVGVAVSRIADRLATETYRGLVVQKESLDLNRATVSIKSEISRTQNELVALANGGDTKSGEYLSRVAKMDGLYKELVSNPRLAYPKEAADFERSQFFGQLEANAIAFHVVSNVYDKQGSAAAMKSAEGILTDPTLNLTNPQRESGYRAAVQQISQRQRADQVNSQSINTSIDNVDQMAALGYKPRPEAMADLQRAVAASNDPTVVRHYQSTMQMLPILDAWRQMGPVELERHLGMLNANIRDKGADPFSVALETQGQKMLATMRKEIANDPLGWADRVGVALATPIDLKDPDVTKSMRARVATAEVVSRWANIPPTYLRPEEKKAFEIAASQGGAAMMGTARAIVDGFGDRSGKVLAEVSKDAPKLAHMGGLLNGGLFGGGSTLFAADVAEAVQLQSNPEGKKTLPHWVNNPTDKIYQFELNRKVEQYGDAFIQVPNNGRGAEESAKAAFMVRAMRHGYDPQNIDSGGTVKDAYNRALQEAAGATFDGNGKQYGGVTDYGSKGMFPWSGGYKVLVPATIQKDRFKDVIGAISDDDLKLMPVSPQAADGKPYTARDIKNAVPVAVPGGYRFAAGDPGSDAPKWIRGADGQPFVLNVDALESKLRKRVPDAFVGSAGAP